METVKDLTYELKEEVETMTRILAALRIVKKHVETVTSDCTPAKAVEKSDIRTAIELLIRDLDRCADNLYNIEINLFDVGGKSA